ncbi:MAG TPA: PAS domain S-box protein, partial [Pseudomonadales bacterium]|nr:PAS domain S-box protein [Pseudomonadales bacterium]
MLTDESGTISVAILNKIVDVMPAAVLVVDEHGLIRHVNRELEKTLLYQREELAACPIDQLLPERFRSVHTSLLQNYMKDPVKRSMGQGQALFARRKDGSEIQIEIGLNPVVTTSGIFVLATMANVTARNKADLLFRQVVESAPYGILVLDHNGKILLTNRMLMDVFGYSSSELLNQSVEMLLPDRYREQHVSLRARYSENPVMRRMGPGRDLTGLHKDGSEFPVEIGLNPIEIAGEQCMMAAVTDITERKKMELDLRRANANLE